MSVGEDFTLPTRTRIGAGLHGHAHASYHMFACTQISKWNNNGIVKTEPVANDQNQVETGDIDIKTETVIVEMHDSDDEPLNKIIKRNEDVIDISFKDEISDSTVKSEVS